MPALRSIVQALVMAAIGALLLNTWVLSGLVVPAVVSGSSMAPALLGAHYAWQCAGCQREICCDRDSLPPSGDDIVCPRCGDRNPAALGTARPGRRLLIDRGAFSWRKPRRWEAVALRSPEDGAVCVKRIVGLPGESIEIERGDLVVDGRRPHRPRVVQVAMAVTVADEADLAQWHSLREGAWQLDNQRWQHRPGQAGRIDWLEYQHREPATPAGNSPSPILDGSPVNQNESRRLNPVSDVTLRCTLHGSSASRCYLTIHTRGDELRFSVPLGGGGARLSHNGTRVKAGRIPPGHADQLELEATVADGRFSLRAAGQPVMEYEFEPLPRQEDPGPRLAIGADEAALAVSGLAVLRDTHYTPGPKGQTRYRLGADEYFVLGDNSANSLDSRSWHSRGGVTGALLLGPVLAW